MLLSDVKIFRQHSTFEHLLRLTIPRKTFIIGFLSNVGVAGLKGGIGIVSFLGSFGILGACSAKLLSQPSCKR